MKETANEGPASEEARARLREVRLALLRLHKILLDAERDTYERAHGRVTAGELLQLVINDEHFAWLHAVSEIIVSADELLDADEPATEAQAGALFAQARSLVRPDEGGGEFGRRYFAALQRDPSAVLAHREVVRSLAEGS